MKPEDVPDEWVWQLAASLDHPSVFMGGPSERNKRRAREALAAVLPLAVAEEREACAKMIEGMGPMGSRYDVAHAIRSRGEPR